LKAKLSQEEIKTILESIKWDPSDYRSSETTKKYKRQEGGAYKAGDLAAGNEEKSIVLK
jgi:hypothetical protein